MRFFSVMPIFPVFRKIFIRILPGFLPIFLFGCSTPVLPPVHVSSFHIKKTKPKPSQSLIRSRLLKDLSRGDYSMALANANRLPDKNERLALAALIRRERNVGQKNQLGGLISRGDNPGALKLLVRIQKQSTTDYRNDLVELDPDLLSHYLLWMIHSGQEKQAIRIMKLVQSDKYARFRWMTSSAYARWSARRFHQKRYRDALLLSHQSLSINPKNDLAKSVVSRILVLRDQLTTKGLIAYRHQKIHSAIAFWRKALDMDPSNPQLKGYILEAEGILGKLRLLKNNGKAQNHT